jgi:PKD repeat protein
MKIANTQKKFSKVCMLLLALFLTSLGTPAAADVIIDNGASGTSSTGTWTASVGAGYYGTNSLFARPSATYTWQYTSQPAGTYEVLLWWTQTDTRGDSVAVRVATAGGPVDVTINQQTNGGQWNSLGNFNLASNAAVTITASTQRLADGRYVATCADAVWFRQVAGNSAPTAVIDSLNPNPANSGEMIVFDGHGDDPDGNVAAYSWDSDIDGHLSDNMSFSSNLLADGTHVISFRVQDNEGLWSAAATMSLTVGEPSIERVIDNGGAGTSFTGTWSPSSGVNPYGTNSLYARPAATYTWQFDSLTPGTYEVFMWWTAATTRGSAIPVNVNGLQTVNVNQLANGGQWNSLGTFTFGTSGYVTITAVGTTSTCADAVRLVSVDLNASPTATIDAISPNPAGFDTFVAFSGHGTAVGSATIAEYRWESSLDGLLGTEASFSAGPLTLGTHTISFTVTDSNGEVSAVAQQQLVVGNPVITIDNGGPGTSSTGTWSVSTGPNPYGSNSIYARPTATYTWQFASQPAGLYNVYIWYTATSTRASAVPVNINGLETVTVDQRTGGGQWNHLGAYPFNGSGYVTVTAVGTASTCADAVRFEFVSGTNPPVAQITSITPNPAEVEEVISFAGQGTDTDGSIVEYLWTSSIDGQLSDQAAFDAVLSLGVHEISFSVRDNDGTWSDAATQSVTVRETLHTVAADNGGAGTSSTGTWTVSAQPNFYGTSSLYARNGATYTWRFNPPVSAVYIVNMWWTAYSGRSNNVPVDITSAGGTQRVYVNQQLNGGRWNALGQYQFLAGNTYTVTITAPAGTASTSADAVQFVEMSSHQAPAANFSADSTGGVVPITVQFTDLSTGDIDSWLWNFGDGATSTEQSPNHQYAAAGNYTVSLTVTNRFGSDTRTRSNYIQVAAASVENIYVALGWGSTYTGTWQNLEWDIDDIGAVEISPDVWRYSNTAKGVTYYIRPISTVAAFEDAIREPGAHIIYNGHSNYGYGLGFLTTGQQDDVDVFDDPLISNVSTDFTAPSISGLMFGQAFPNWKPEYSWGESAIMPYDFGDPRGLPPYNYYATYTRPGDATHYRIESADGSYIERFPDSGRPAWYSPTGSPPDPVLNPEYFITNPDPDFPHVTYTGTWPWASPGDWHVELYNGQTYQYHSAGSGANRATFNVVVPAAGSYNVYATWYPQAANATNTPYRIQHGSLAAPSYTTVLANQEVGAELNLLGTFTYNQAGTYTIEVSDNANGTVIADAVQLQYAADPASYVTAEFSSAVMEGSSPLTVQFINRSIVYLQGVRRPTVTYLWNFGDGSTSTERDPMHTYTTAGIYTVSLTTTNQNGTSDNETKQAYMHVGSAVAAAPRAQFFARSFSGNLPRTANFYDQSKGNVTGWLWNFGDGQTSTEQNPVHTYTGGGPFTVSLTVSGPDGSDTITKSSYAHTIVGSRIVDNTDQYKYHYGGIYSGSYIGRAIMDARPVTVPLEEMRYSRFFFNGCVSESYYLPKFTRGVVFYTLDNRDELLDPSSDYIVEYLLGASDDEILEVINSVNYIHGYFDFNKLPPSMR